MRSININTIIYIFITPIITLLLWLLGDHSWLHFLNTFFSLSLIISIFLFTLLLVQEGIFDVTSYGFRKFRYQMMRKKSRRMYEEDTFHNPKSPKREHYDVQPWIKPVLIVNTCYFILSILLSFMI
ncbi:DUF3899 domain-containing protein [Staphylococcus americanisciuri]|uniref:DUF3899 domain-containing protein n=1 Tax=Staphylococcus americanisciuri TaxID=2973940 RepID=A0ABT2F2V5_9STAP|nr:DUF3899 domain-containing protein [Staphylococcus americanisciuri]MCS4486781.1 DUF3899 domain-containing protein [Staphylococcus americanisciuri]